MSQKITVTLILADRVKDELEKLDMAEAERDSKAVAKAKEQIRNSISVQAFSDMKSTKDVSPDVLDIYRRYFRDVGDNTLVFTEEALQQSIDAMRKSKIKF